ncbi:MAG: DUF2382 domain-containing protein [Rubrobacter sp.]|nr:DUF2382 domain-containing protein [Rubrobacter sp.]
MAHEERDRPAEGYHEPAEKDAGERGVGPGDELRVQRGEEELRAETREREAGAMRVRKSVRTDHEQLRVPKRREEVDIERVPVNRESPGAEIGEEEVVVQVFEEEVVVSKRVVLKEEIRLRKVVVEEEEVIEEDVRREEVEIDDETGRGTEPDGKGRRDG